MTISVAEILTILICAAAMSFILAVATWIMFNRSKFQQPRERHARLDELDREYEDGHLGDADCQRCRFEILDNGVD